MCPIVRVSLLQRERLYMTEYPLSRDVTARGGYILQPCEALPSYAVDCRPDLS
jgi:hypothetical protein